MWTRNSMQLVDAASNKTTSPSGKYKCGWRESVCGTEEVVECVGLLIVVVEIGRLQTTHYRLLLYNAHSIRELTGGGVEEVAEGEVVRIHHGNHAAPCRAFPEGYIDPCHERDVEFHDDQMKEGRRGPWMINSIISREVQYLLCPVGCVLL